MWFRRRSRRPKMTPFHESQLPPRREATFEGSVGEGLMLAEYASRMALKNSIVIGGISGPDAYDPELYIPRAREVLERFAAESERAAERLAEELSSASKRSGIAGHAHDYKAGDARNLKRREAVSRALAKRLRERNDDHDYLLTLLERARDDAWHDIARAMEDSLDRGNITVDADYEKHRAKRMRLLISEDLAELAHSREPVPRPDPDPDY